jgi:hypothetical protein
VKPGEKFVRDLRMNAQIRYWGLRILATIPVAIGMPLLALSDAYLFLLRFELSGQMSEPRTLHWLAVLTVPPAYILACGIYFLLVRRLIRLAQNGAAILAAAVMLLVSLTVYYWLYFVLY